MVLSKALSIKLHRSQLQLLVIIGFLIAGSILRLLWADDMEWKIEEKWMFEQAQLIASGAAPLPLVGMESSVLVRNPGMSVWCFALLAKVAHDPIAMVRCIQWLNILTIWLFFGFVLWKIANNQRKPWLWGLAITSVNPFAVLFSRKIWTPDILAPFCFLVFLGHWFRKKFWGSFLWGIAGITSGQVQMGGFFLTLGLLVWTLWHDYNHKTLKKTAWTGWIFGTILGGIPLVPWFWEVFPQMGGYRRSIVGLLVPKFYSQWVSSALGVNLSYSIKQAFWHDFLREPLVFGIPTYLMIPAHLFLVGIGLYALYRWFKSRKGSPLTKLQSKEVDREDKEDKGEKVLCMSATSYQKALTHEVEPALVFYLKAMAVGVGGAFTLSAVNVHPYYITIVFPFMYMWLAQLYQNKVRLLVAIALVQLFITVTFLVFIHRTGGIPFTGSGYGISYRLQLEQHQTQPLSTGKGF